MRVPEAGKAVRERERLIAHLQQKVAYFRAFPASRREAECADEGVRDCIAMLREHGIDAE